MNTVINALKTMATEMSAFPAWASRLEEISATLSDKSAGKLTGREVAKQVSAILNMYGDEEHKTFLEALARDHRSLQQSFTRLCKDWFLTVADPEYRFDGRNEASVQLARALKPVLDEKGWLPFI